MDHVHLLRCSFETDSLVQETEKTRTDISGFTLSKEISFSPLLKLVSRISDNDRNCISRR